MLTCSFFSLQAQADNNDVTTDDHDVKIIIPNFAILDVEPEATLSIDLTAGEPTEAGTALNFANATNADLWLNYSSIVATSETRKITVQTSAAIPAGLELKVTAAPYAGADGGGITGAPTTEVTLSTTAADIVTGIGSCYTGDGNTNGHNLNYALNAIDADYGNIVSSTAGTTITITYTIVTE